MLASVWAAASAGVFAGFGLRTLLDKLAVPEQTKMEAHYNDAVNTRAWSYIKAGMEPFEAISRVRKEMKQEAEAVISQEGT